MNNNLVVDLAEEASEESFPASDALAGHRSPQFVGACGAKILQKARSPTKQPSFVSEMTRRVNRQLNLTGELIGEGRLK